MGFLIFSFTTKSLSHKVTKFSTLLALVSLCLSGGSLTGCSGSKLKTELRPSSSDWPMYGKSPERRFFDSSSFAFPLTLAWEYDASAGFSQAPMAIAGSTLLVGTLQGELHAVDLETGKRIGILKTYAPVQAAPALMKRDIIIGLESSRENLIAYKPETGEERWIRDIGSVAASPLVWNNQIIVGGLNGKFAAVDQYGIELWSIDTKAEIYSSPALSESTVYCATTKGEVFAVNAVDGTVIWKAKTGKAVYAGVTVADTIVIVASRDSSLYFFNARTGATQRKIVLGNKAMATPSVFNNVLYVSSLEGEVTAWNIATGDMLWKFKAQSVINTSPFVTPSAIFVASLDKNIYALNPANGSILWKKELESRIKTTPLVWKNMLLVAAEDKTVYCFKSPKR